MPVFIDLAGREFGRWKVIRRAENNRHNQPQWHCRCACGVEGVVRGGNLVAGDSQSCGCLNVDVHRQMCRVRNTTHGMRRTPTYIAWVNMLQRCENPRATAYRKYGAKGVTVCERWHVFADFLADMGECPAGLSLDRRDNARGYEPDNCRWVTMQAQQNNRGGNRKLTVRGETLGIVEWGRRSGIDHHTILARLRKGMSPEEAVAS